MALASAIAWIPSNSPAQLLGLGELSGSLRSSFEYNREDTRSGGSRSNFQDILNKTELTLRDSGYLIDPRLITFFASGTGGLLNGRTSGTDIRDNKNDTLWGYNISALILPEKNLNLSLFADRSQSFFTGDAAGRIDTLTENYGASLSVRHFYIPSRISYRQEFSDTESSSRGVLSQSRFQRNVLSYEGRRGWTDQELYARYEYVDYTDEVVSASSYKSYDGNLSYNIDFGTNLNWHSDSALIFSNRSGRTDQTVINANERLTIDHTDRFRTEYGYIFNRSDNQNGVSTSQQGRFQINHRLYDSLETNGTLSASLNNYPQGRQNNYAGSANISYTKRLPFGGVLNTGLGGGLGYNSSRFGGDENFVSQENYSVATPFALPISLKNPSVVAASIVVTKIAFGPLPIGCALPPGPPTDLLLGRDYTLRQIGNVTEIVPIPCSGTVPGLNPGDVIAVDYRFSVPSSLTYLETNWNFNASVDYGWIRPFFLFEQTVETRLSGQADGFLNDELRRTIGTELRYDGQRFFANATGEFQQYTSDRTEFDRFRIAERANFIVNPDLRIGVTGDQFLTRYTKPKRDNRGAGLRARLDYHWSPSLSGDAVLGVLYFKESDGPEEFTGEVGAGLRWTYRNVEVIPRLQFFNRQRGDTTTREMLLTLQLIRRF